MLDLVHCSCRVAFEGRFGKAYNEEAFRYLLEIHRRRAEQRGEAVFLMLVSVKRLPGLSRRLSPASAGKVFGAFWLCLRDVDFTGWFRADRVAGAVLTHASQQLSPAVVQNLTQRITKTLDSRVRAQTASRLQVRVLQLRPGLRS
jgi:hypothetical protein